MTFKEWANQAHVGDVCKVRNIHVECVEGEDGPEGCGGCLLQSVGCYGVHCGRNDRPDGVPVMFVDGYARHLLDEPVVSLAESGKPTLAAWSTSASVGDRCKVGNSVLECVEKDDSPDSASACDSCAMRNCDCADVCCESYVRHNLTGVYFALRKGDGKGLEPHMPVTPLPRQEEGEQ